MTVLLRAARRSWRWYVGLLDRKPLLAQATTTGIICGLGDLIAQQVIHKHTWWEHNWKRTASMTAIGFAFTGPVLKVWFVSLDRVFGPSQGFSVVIKKLAADQLLFAPILYVCILQLFGLAQGLNFQERQNKTKEEYFNVLLSGYKVWPFANLVNFYVIPLKFRVNFANVVSLGWNTYLAWVAHR